MTTWSPIFTRASLLLSASLCFLSIVVGLPLGAVEDAVQHAVAPQQVALPALAERAVQPALLDPEVDGLAGPLQQLGELRHGQDGRESAAEVLGVEGRRDLRGFEVDAFAAH